MASRIAVQNKSVFSREALWSDNALLIYLALIVLVGHLLTNTKYGYQRDEFYYITCGQHLAWGYVDHPPLTPVMANISLWLFGNSLFAVRFFPAVAGALLVLVTGLITRELGGCRYAQVAAATTTMMAPLFIAANGLLMPISLDILAWTFSSYLVLRIIKYEEHKSWLLVGVTVGLGLLNKYNMAFYCAGLLIGLLAVGPRRVFRTGWFWLGSLTALLIVLPNLLWQVQHGWPTLEFLRNLNQNVMSRISHPMFLLWQVVIINPCTLPLWLAGLYYYLFTKEGKPYRVFGIIFVSILAFLLLAHGKPYYLGAAYPILLAAGPVLILNIARKKRWQWDRVRTTYVVLLSVGAILAFPAVLPALPPESSLRYEMSKIDKNYAEILGWDELVAQVNDIYKNELSDQDRAQAAILTENYGEAGALDILGEQYGLPKPLSGHNTYYLWGPGKASGQVCITVGISSETVHSMFDDVKLVGLIANSQGIQNEEFHKPIFICRKPKNTLQALWPLLRHYD